MTKFTIPLKYFIFLQLSHRRCLSQHKVKSGMACWHKIKCDMVGWYGIIEAILTSTTDTSLAAGHIFTKVLRVVVAFWRSKCHRIIMFLDNGIGGAKNFDVAVSKIKHMC